MRRVARLSALAALEPATEAGSRVRHARDATRGSASTRGRATARAHLVSPGRHRAVCDNRPAPRLAARPLPSVLDVEDRPSA
jgi:hypothetical protein